MNKMIIPKADATEEHLATIGRLREAIIERAMVKLLVDIRTSFKAHRDWQIERDYLIQRHQSPLLTKLLAALEASGVTLREALSVPLWFAMNAR